MNTRRIDRLLRIITVLHSGRSLSVEDLANELGVTRRTVFRDLEVLDRAGAPFKFDRREKRYKIDHEFFVPPISFTLKECLALMFLTRKMLNQDVSPDFAAATRAAIKLESALPHELLEHCEGLLTHMDFELPPVSPADGFDDHLNKLQAAAVEHRKVKIGYEPPDKPSFEDVLHPYHLAFIIRGWYVIGFSENESAVRTFKVERISQCEPLQRLFEAEDYFSLSDYFGNAWSMIRGNKRHHVKIHFSPQVATNVEEVVWHKTQSTIRNQDDSLVFEVDVDGIEEISWWLMGYGEQAVVLEPPELRELILKRARQMCRNYEAAFSNEHR